MIEMLGSSSRKAISADAVSAEKRRLPSHVLITLTGRDGFAAHTRLPKGTADTHVKAMNLRLPDLAPVDPAGLTIAATAIRQNEDGGATYEIAMARKERLNQLEADARRRGARSVRFKVEGASSVELQSPRAGVRSASSHIFDAALVIAVVVGAVSAVAVWTARTNVSTQMLAEEERSLRRAAVAAEASRKAGEVSRQLVERGILTRRGNAALEALGFLNAATPNDTWWTRVRWAPGEVTIFAQSPNANTAITALSAAAKGWSIELVGSLNSASTEGLQSFEVLAKSRAVQPR